MAFHQRYLHLNVAEDLNSHMVFIGGPRQVGKTTFALSFLSPAAEPHPAYLNWDDIVARQKLLKGELPPNQDRFVLDEIHKFIKWRSLVKGFFDTGRARSSFIVTGSARLDYYSKGGDSLQGRYHYYRLHPFSMTEMPEVPDKQRFELLMRFGGFPEPLLRADETFWRRWQRERLRRVIYDDIRELEHLKEISMLELLAEALPERVGAPLSIKNLKESLQAAHETVERWVRIFERMYLCFRIPPFGPPNIRAVKKEQKLYLWDWSMVPEPGPRFENLVASHLLKYCHFLEDAQGYRMELRFLRDNDKREVDFVVLQDRKPLFAVECKTGEKAGSPSCFYFKARTQIPLFYQVHQGEKDYTVQGLRVLPFITFCHEVLQL